MSLSGPSRVILVEPVEAPAEEPVRGEPRPAAAPAPPQGEPAPPVTTAP